MPKKFKYIRQDGALQRLELQLELGKKNTNAGPVDLSDRDRKRIPKEISKLQSQLVGI